MRACIGLSHEGKENDLTECPLVGFCARGDRIERIEFGAVLWDEEIVSVVCKTRKGYLILPAGI